MVTIAALIARNQTIEMPYHCNLELDNGVKPREIFEILCISRFTPAGRMRWRQWPWRKMFLPIVRSERIKLPRAEPALLPLNKQAEAKRAANAEQQFGNVARDRAVHY